VGGGLPAGGNSLLARHNAPVGKIAAAAQQRQSSTASAGSHMTGREWAQGHVVSCAVALYKKKRRPGPGAHTHDPFQQRACCGCAQPLPRCDECATTHVRGCLTAGVLLRPSQRGGNMPTHAAAAAAIAACCSCRPLAWMHALHGMRAEGNTHTHASTLNTTHDTPRVQGPR
jgi:hypothetical protein